MAIRTERLNELSNEVTPQKPCQSTLQRRGDRDAHLVLCDFHAILSDGSGTGKGRRQALRPRLNPVIGLSSAMNVPAMMDWLLI